MGPFLAGAFLASIAGLAFRNAKSAPTPTRRRDALFRGGMFGAAAVGALLGNLSPAAGGSLLILAGLMGLVVAAWGLAQRIGRRPRSSS